MGLADWPICIDHKQSYPEVPMSRVRCDPRSLLHAAAGSGEADLVAYLLAKGASPNTADDEVAQRSTCTCTSCRNLDCLAWNQ